MADVITQDMKIGEILTKYPMVLEPLLSTGVHCVGCGAANFESLGDGLRGHGMDDAKVEEVMKMLNKAVADAKAYEAEQEEQ